MWISWKRQNPAKPTQPSPPAPNILTFKPLRPVKKTNPLAEVSKASRSCSWVTFLSDFLGPSRVSFRTSPRLFICGSLGFGMSLTSSTAAPLLTPYLLTPFYVVLAAAFSVYHNSFFAFFLVGLYFCSCFFQHFSSTNFLFVRIYNFTWHSAASWDKNVFFSYSLIFFILYLLLSRVSLY